MEKTAEDLKKAEAKKANQNKKNNRSRLGVGLILIGLLSFVLFSTNSCGQIRGSGNVIEQGREVSGFDEIELDGIGEITLIQGEQEGLVVEAEDNLMEFIETTVRGDTLSIVVGRNRSINPTRSIRFTITVNDLEKIELNGASSVEADRLEIESLELSMDGTGSITIDELEAEELDSVINGLGSVKVNGEVEELKVDINGSGSFDGEALDVEDASIQINGLGSVELGESEKLDIEINGSGSVSYVGNPDISQDINGLGSVNQR